MHVQPLAGRHARQPDQGQALSTDAAARQHAECPAQLAKLLARPGATLPSWKTAHVTMRFHSWDDTRNNRTNPLLPYSLAPLLCFPA